MSDGCYASYQTSEKLTTTEERQKLESWGWQEVYTDVWQHSSLVEIVKYKFGWVYSNHVRQEVERLLKDVVTILEEQARQHELKATLERKSASEIQKALGTERDGA